MWIKVLVPIMPAPTGGKHINTGGRHNTNTLGLGYKYTKTQMQIHWAQINI